MDSATFAANKEMLRMIKLILDTELFCLKLIKRQKKKIGTSFLQ